MSQTPRTHSIYVSPVISKCYRLVAIKLGRKCSEDVIEEVLLAALSHSHPEIYAHVESQEIAEEEFRKSITPKP
jgi:hypothetical protein